MPFEIDSQPPAPRSAPHRVYRLADGRVVPSVTQVLSIIAKPQLVSWANKLGLEEKSADVVRRETAARGTEVHAMIAAHLAEEPPPSPSSPEVAAAFEGYLAWRKAHVVEPVYIEWPFVVENYDYERAYAYGGTVDLVARVDGVNEVIDFKTTSRIFEDQFYQLAAYHHLVIGNTELVPGRVRIVRLGTTPMRPEYEELARNREDLVPAWRVFAAALELHRALRAGRAGDGPDLPD